MSFREPAPPGQLLSVTVALVLGLLPVTAGAVLSLGHVGNEECRRQLQGLGDSCEAADRDAACAVPSTLMIGEDRRAGPPAITRRWLRECPRNGAPDSDAQ
jgi:hypothetical protein